ncbi:hypothetical protein QBC46DRAFT_413219 [Diplogelasinospora grovesii]|uniref:Uncharacterized protein n=1 Tax=Diplogelasinospora grovesii TaxID=303347 RepID=A0AAN6N0G3_9PEZI|nr:hypothetical protein QBC46DRAFT_413219 [Diplogelasinospora grovesii]
MVSLWRLLRRFANATNALRAAHPGPPNILEPVEISASITATGTSTVTMEPLPLAELPMVMTTGIFEDVSSPTKSAAVEDTPTPGETFCSSDTSSVPGESSTSDSSTSDKSTFDNPPSSPHSLSSASASASAVLAESTSRSETTQPPFNLYEDTERRRMENEDFALNDMEFWAAWNVRRMPRARELRERLEELRARQNEAHARVLEAMTSETWEVESARLDERKAIEHERFDLENEIWNQAHSYRAIDQIERNVDITMVEAETGLPLGLGRANKRVVIIHKQLRPARDVFIVRHYESDTQAESADLGTSAEEQL